MQEKVRNLRPSRKSCSPGTASTTEWSPPISLPLPVVCHSTLQKERKRSSPSTG